MASREYELYSNQFKFLRFLGKGSFGDMQKCLKMDTREIVAAKIPREKSSANNEIRMMKEVMDFSLDLFNIVKFFGWFNLNEKVLVFEMLDMNLGEYYKRFSPLLLSEIRTVIKHVATALDALKIIGVIHTDIHQGNIMLVDHREECLTFKLIDFGLAIPRSKAKPGMTLQPEYYRSPEIFLGLPFSEAIDMWALGVILAYMISGLQPFLGRFKLIIDILGQPADHLLNNGLRTQDYFERSESNNWISKVPQMFLTYGCYIADNHFIFRPLDRLKTILMEDNDQAEEYQCEQCIEILKAILKMDAAERILPIEVLDHPFIVNHPFQGESSAIAPRDDSDIQPDHRCPSPTIPPDVIMVQPATPENALQLEDEERADSLQTPIKESSRSLSWFTGEYFETFACALWDDGNTSIQPDPSSPSPTVPSGVIHPATLENTPQLEAQESADSLQTGLNKMSESNSDVFSGDIGIKKKKKKKNSFRRFCSWMRKTFCSCWTFTDEDDEGKNEAL